MTKTVFRLSVAAMVYITILVAGLLVFVWLHWRGQRYVALGVFSVLTALATTLYTIRGEMTLDPQTRELIGKRTWLGLPVRKMIIRLGSNDALHLTEDISHGRNAISVSHRLEASGDLVSQPTTEPGPYIVISESSVKNRALLEDFARDAATALGVPLHDTRKFTERIAKYKQQHR